jgi:hypothetical protein
MDLKEYRLKNVSGDMPPQGCRAEYHFRPCFGPRLGCYIQSAYRFEPETLQIH